jgi:uncharacterized protein YcbK (DUF882 family)
MLYSSHNGKKQLKLVLMNVSDAQKTKKQKTVIRSGVSAFLAFAASILCVNSDQEATAYGDTRSVSLYYTHTKETLDITYKRNGYYDQDAIKKLSYHLRDWRRDEPTNMDPKLFDVLWEVYREAGYEGQTINVVSAYRSPETNGMLRRRSRAVAKHSQHTLGKAMDTTMPGVSMSKIREIGVRLQRGGVGYYPTAGTPFVHLDVGGVRAWPRLSSSQLLRLFPDQRTVHLPSDGPPLAGYQEALADIQRYGGSIGGSDEEEGNGRGLFAALFGGGGSKSSRATSSRSGGTQLALANTTSSGDDAGSKSFFLNNGSPERVDIAPSVRTSNRITRLKIEPKPIPTAPIQAAPQQAEPVQPTAPVQIQQPVQQIQFASLRPKPIEDEFNSATTAPVIPLPPTNRPPAIAEQPATSPLIAAIVPMPPRRPNDFVVLASLTTASVPFPPSRPTNFGKTRVASLDDGYFPTTPVAQSAAEPIQAPPVIMGRIAPKSSALGFAASETASQSPRVASSASVVSSASVTSAPRTSAAKKEIAQQNVTLDTLMSQVAVQDNRGASKRVETPQVSKLVQSGIVATKFESFAPKTLVAGKFTSGLTPTLGASFIKSATE